MLEFMIRYEELKIDAFTEPQPVPTKYTIYLEYYKKHITFAFRRIENPILFEIKPWFEENFDPEGKYWPYDAMNYIKDYYFDPHPKTAGMRILKEILVPLLLVNILVLYILCKICRKCPCCCCCRRSDEDEIEKEKED